MLDYNHDNLSIKGLTEIIFFNCTILFDHNNNLLFAQLYGIKYFYLIQIISAQFYASKIICIQLYCFVKFGPLV